MANDVSEVVVPVDSGNLRRVAQLSARWRLTASAWCCPTRNSAGT